MFSISSIDSKHSALFDDELPDCVDINGVENGFFELKRVRNSFRKHRARCWFVAFEDHDHLKEEYQQLAQNHERYEAKYNELLKRLQENGVI